MLLLSSVVVVFYLLFAMSWGLKCHKGTGKDNYPGEASGEECEENPECEKAVCFWEEDDKGNIKKYGCTHGDLQSYDMGCKEVPTTPWKYMCWCRADNCNGHNRANPLGTNMKAPGYIATEKIATCYIGEPGTKNMPGSIAVCEETWWNPVVKTVCFWQETVKGDIVKYGCKEVYKFFGTDDGCVDKQDEEYKGEESSWRFDCRCKDKNNCNFHNTPDPLNKNPMSNPQTDGDGDVESCYAGTIGEKNMPGDPVECQDATIPIPVLVCPFASCIQTVCYHQEDKDGDIVKYGCVQVVRGLLGWDEGCQPNSDDHHYLWECRCKQRANCNYYDKPNPLGKNPEANNNRLTGVSARKNPNMGIVFCGIAMVAAAYAFRILD